jgi:hypothetical protein
MQKDGFDLNETVSYKLLRASGEQFDLEVEYSTELDNTTGTFIAGSFAAIENFKMTATAIGEEFNASVEMYPNPASDLLNIKGINTSTELTIFNVFGEEVYRQELSSSTAVNVSSYAKGTYVVKITTSAGDSFKKLVIQ